MGIHERITKLETDVAALQSGETTGDYDVAITALRGDVASLKDELKSWSDIGTSVSELTDRIEKLEGTRTVAKKATVTGGSAASPAGS